LNKKNGIQINIENCEVGDVFEKGGRRRKELEEM
jgi:hypothetical protein